MEIQVYREVMKHFRIALLLSLACKPVAESQTVQQPRPTTAPIPQTVGAARRTPVVMVAHNVLPSVVNIQTEATMRRREVDPFFDPFGIFGGTNQSYTSLGSGFVWSSDGIIVTNNHVIEGASRITVFFSDRTELRAKLIGVDPDSDVAVLRVGLDKYGGRVLADAATRSVPDISAAMLAAGLARPYGGGKRQSWCADP